MGEQLTALDPTAHGIWRYGHSLGWLFYGHILIRACCAVGSERLRRLKKVFQLLANDLSNHFGKEVAKRLVNACEQRHRGISRLQTLLYRMVEAQSRRKKQ